jgi:hypothetical protein
MRKLLLFGLAAAAIALIGPAFAGETFNWNTNQNLVTVDIHSRTLPRLLEEIASTTGWQVFLEPGTTHNTSAKFRELPPGEALHLLLGDLNFALVPQTNASPRLFVFRTGLGNATKRIRPASETSAKHTAGKIPNELVVRLRPGAKIDDLARALGAKVIGRIDGLNAYRLAFSDEAATQTAWQSLSGNEDVTGVEYNYYVDPSPSAVQLNSSSVAPLQLTLNPSIGSGQPIVGLIDTAVQPLGNNLDKFLVKSLSVAGDANSDSGSPTHGTSMFEDILRAAAAVTGGSSSMQVLSVDVYGPNATTSTFDVANGITLAVNNGANVLNLSLGGPGDSPLLQDLIQQVITQNGIPVIAAAGNSASSSPFYPAAYPGVISVTASTATNPGQSAAPGPLASYANYGNWVDLIAPGQSVVYFGGNAWLVSGTSTSTAYVSGMIGGFADRNRTTTRTAAATINTMSALQFSSPK